MTDDRKLSVVVEEFAPRVSNTLRGFATITIPELDLRIFDVSIHEKGASRWIGLPAKPQIGRDDRVIAALGRAAAARAKISHQYCPGAAPFLGALAQKDRVQKIRVHDGQDFRNRQRKGSDRSGGA